MYDPNAVDKHVIAQSCPPRFTKSSFQPSSDSSALSSTWSYFDRAVMVIGLIPSLLPIIGDAYRSLFYTGAIAAEKGPIRMLRLYLGRTFPTTTSELAPGKLVTDPPLDQDRYARLAEALAGSVELPTLSKVAHGMGSVLATLHFGAGVDGSDIELVLAGDHYHSARCYVFDYNQCHPWLKIGYLETKDISLESPTTGEFAKNDMVTAAERIAVKIIGQEFYYPRPGQALYDDFTSGYRYGVKKLLDKHTVTSLVVSQVMAAAEAFLENYHKAGEERNARQSRMNRAKPEL